MRTIQEIKDRIKEKADVFGCESNLMMVLEYEDAKEYLKKETTKESWDKVHSKYGKDAIIESMKTYMKFALDKAHNHRGLSASRSIMNFSHWLWLLEDNETLSFLDDHNNYAQYGVPMLKKICDKYGFDFTDDEEMKRMSEGKKCHDECDMGCGQ